MNQAGRCYISAGDKKELQSGFSGLSLLIFTLPWNVSKFELTSSQLGSILIGLTNGNQFKFSLNASNRDFAATQGWLAVQETLRILEQVIQLDTLSKLFLKCYKLLWLNCTVVEQLTMISDCIEQKGQKRKAVDFEDIFRDVDE